MSNIFKALEQAQRERSGAQAPPSTTPNPAAASQSPDVKHAAIVALSQAIDASLPGGKKIVQFISAHAGEGVSFIADELARIAASSFGKQVLLIRTITDAAVQRSIPNFEREIQRLKELTEQLLRAEDMPAKPACTPSVMTLGNCLSTFRADQSLIGRMREVYDLVIVDTPSYEKEPFGVELARYADGVIIVVEAERTKAFAVENLKDKLLQNAGNIIGVALNKRTFHIPTSLYKLLH